MFDKNVLALPGARLALATLALASALDAVLGIGQAACLARALTALWEGGAMAGQVPLALGFLTCFVARQVVILVRDARIDAFARDRAAELRRELLGRTYDGGRDFVQREGSGSVTTALLEGTGQVQTYLGLILPKMADVMVIPLVVLVYLFGVDWVSGVIALVVFPFIIMYMVMLGGTAKIEAARRHDEYEALSNHFLDSVRGIATLKVFGQARAHGTIIYQVSERFRKATLRTLRVATLSSAALDLFATFGLAAVSIMLGFRLMAGTMALEPALVCLILVPEYFRPIRRFSGDFHASLDGRNALVAINRMLAQPAVEFASTPLPTWDDASELRLLDVGFSYPEPIADRTKAAGEPKANPDQKAAPHEDSPAPTDAGGDQGGGRSSGENPAAPTLADVSLKVRGCKRIGIVGESGAGKSTLVNMLAGFADPTEGRCEIEREGLSNREKDQVGQVTDAPVDCFQIPTLACDAWRRQVAYLPQDPRIFHATLRENVCFYHPDATDDQVEAAVRAAGLDDLVCELPHGLDTLVGEGARALSGGQAQRVALARVLLDDSRRVLVFDEPTAHLDIETELALKERMLPLMEGRLVFFATHRLHWIADMDLVWVIENGTVAQVGTPSELASDPEGAFARLVSHAREAI